MIHLLSGSARVHLEVWHARQPCPTKPLAPLYVHPARIVTDDDSKRLMGITCSFRVQALIAALYLDRIWHEAQAPAPEFTVRKTTMNGLIIGRSSSRDDRRLMPQFIEVSTFLLVP